MKLLLVFFFIFSVLHADKVKTKSLACPSIEQLKKAPMHREAGSLDLDMYVIANDCVILMPKDNVEAIGYDPRNSQELFQKIIYKANDKVLYMLRSSLIVEQGGKKASMRF